MNYYLGFDAGTQSVKVAVYDEDMNCIVSSSAPTTLTYPEPGWVSMDVDEYLALTIKGMKECASQMKEKGLDVTKIKSIMGDGVYRMSTRLNSSRKHRSRMPSSA